MSPIPRLPLLSALFLMAVLPALALATPTFEAELIILDGTRVLDVPGYSVPHVVDWNGDDLPDLLVGEGGGGVAEARCRLYLNQGAEGAPVFDGHSTIQTTDGELILPGSGCMGLTPRAVDWNDDGHKDLLMGLADGRVMLLLNTTDDQNPIFDTGTYLTYGNLPLPTTIDVGARATPLTVDYNGDDLFDLLVGSLAGTIDLYLNTGSPGDPRFQTRSYLQAAGGDLVVPTGRSCPIFSDFDGDEVPDLVSGNTEGQLVFYANQGSVQSPSFGAPELLTAGGLPIDLDGTPRSRPCCADWNGDGVWDLVMGASDGLLRVYIQENLSAAGPAALAALLHPPYPNPFNPRVEIRYSLDAPAPVEITVHDLSGRQVRWLFSGTRTAGEHSLFWSGRDATNRRVPAGGYLVRLKTGPQEQVRKVLLVK